MAASLAQSPVTDNLAQAGTTVTLTFGSPTTTGNSFIVVLEGWGPAPFTAVVTDNKGNGTYASITSVGPGPVDNQRCIVAYVQDAAGGASHTITATVQSGGVTAWAIYEVAGMPATSSPTILDAQNTASGVGTTVQAGSTGTLAQAAEIAFAVFTVSGNTQSATPTIDSGFTIDRADNNSNSMPGGGIAHLITSATTALNPAWTVNSVGWAALIVTFMASAAPPLSTTPRLNAKWTHFWGGRK